MRCYLQSIHHTSIYHVHPCVTGSHRKSLDLESEAPANLIGTRTIGGYRKDGIVHARIGTNDRQNHKCIERAKHKRDTI